MRQQHQRRGRYQYRADVFRKIVEELGFGDSVTVAFDLGPRGTRRVVVLIGGQGRTTIDVDDLLQLSPEYRVVAILDRCEYVTGCWRGDTVRRIDSTPPNRNRNRAGAYARKVV